MKKVAKIFSLQSILLIVALLMTTAHVQAVVSCDISKVHGQGYTTSITDVIDNCDGSYTITIRVDHDGCAGPACKELSNYAIQATPGTYTNVSVNVLSGTMTYSNIDLGPNLGAMIPFNGFKVDGISGIGDGMAGSFEVTYTLSNGLQNQQFSAKPGPNTLVVSFTAADFESVMDCNETGCNSGPCDITKDHGQGYSSTIEAVIDNCDGTYTITIRLEHDGCPGPACKELSNYAIQAIPGTYSNVDVAVVSGNFTYSTIDMGPNLGAQIPFQGFKIDGTGNIGDGNAGVVKITYTLSGGLQDQQVSVKPGQEVLTVSFTAAEFEQVMLCNGTDCPGGPTTGLSGNVFHDANGLTDNTVNGTGINAADGQTLYVHLLDFNTGTVIAVKPVNADGTYTFDIGAGQYKVLLSTVQGTVGSGPPPATLPSGWVNTGEFVGAGPGNDNNINGIVHATVVENSITTNVNFGIQQLPVPEINTAPSQENPGGTVSVPVPPQTFVANDPDGIVTHIRIVAFPANATTITIDGVTYTSASFPANGVTIPTNANGNPTVVISVDPIDGPVTVPIYFAAIDNAGFESLTNGIAYVPFTVDGNGGDNENFYPAHGYGTLAFEDLWPAKGDYDFNDLVIDYQFKITMNDNNFINQVKATFIIKAFGASYENGFGFQLSGNVNASNLNVTGFSLTENFITLNPNGTEAGQSKPTIIVYDNAYNEMQHPGVGIGVNTEPWAPYVQPVTLVVTIDFAPNTYTYNQLDIANFNPFIIVNKNRAVEVHLPNYPPTDLADQSMFGMWDDASDAATGKYYVTANNLPWAIHIYEKFDWPIEKQEIVWAHLKFAEWAISGGVMYPNWYKDLPGYRNNSLIYQVPASN